MHHASPHLFLGLALSAECLHYFVGHSEKYLYGSKFTSTMISTQHTVPISLDHLR
jgi:hypothetical protein